MHNDSIQQASGRPLEGEAGKAGGCTGSIVRTMEDEQHQPAPESTVGATTYLGCFSRRMDPATASRETEYNRIIEFTIREGDGVCVSGRLFPGMSSKKLREMMSSLEKRRKLAKPAG